MRESDARDIFGQEQADDQTLALYRAKLVTATNNLNKVQDRKKLHNEYFNGDIKHFKKFQKALAEAVRDKSAIPLIRAFGEENWQRELAELTADYQGDI